MLCKVCLCFYIYILEASRVHPLYTILYLSSIMPSKKNKEVWPSLIESLTSKKSARKPPKQVISRQRATTANPPPPKVILFIPLVGCWLLETSSYVGRGGGRWRGRRAAEWSRKSSMSRLYRNELSISPSRGARDREVLLAWQYYWTSLPFGLFCWRCSANRSYSNLDPICANTCWELVLCTIKHKFPPINSEPRRES